MSKDPAFLFYPGDYLRDTQCLSEKSQVAYDRIMCEHMRNICISQEQLNFFTKRLSEDEKNEVLFLLAKVKGGYQIHWVAESILKRRSYSESRSNNRKNKNKKDMLSYDEHMEIVNVNENKDINNTMWLEIKRSFYNDFRWKEKFCNDKNIPILLLEPKMNEFISDIELKEDLKSLKELKSHFVNWYKVSVKIGSNGHSNGRELSGHEKQIVSKRELAKGKTES